MTKIATYLLGWALVKATRQIYDYHTGKVYTRTMYEVIDHGYKVTSFVAENDENAIEQFARYLGRPLYLIIRVEV